MITPPWLQGQNTPTTDKAGKPPSAKMRPDVYAIRPVVERELSAADKMKSEEFARQYIVDFNQTRAASRMGYAQSCAAKVGNDFFWKPYTQAFLVSLIRSIEERCIVGRNEVLAGLLREANRFDMDASSASRIAAWREIGKILGMFINRIEISANSSGVMEVPMVADSQDWEAIAAGAQTQLLAEVRG